MTTDSLDQRVGLRTDPVPLGILFMLGATVLFALSSAVGDRGRLRPVPAMARNGKKPFAAD